MRDPATTDEHLGEWRWRTYCEHLADLGYDLDGGTDRDREPLTVDGGRHTPLTTVS